MDAARARRDDRGMAFTQRSGESAGRGVMAPRDVTAAGVMAPGVPGPPRPPRPPGSFRRGLRRALREPFTRRTVRECAHASVSLLIAIPLFAFTAVAVTVGLALSVSFAGLPLLALSLRAARRLGDVCRRLANRALAPRAERPRVFRLKRERPIEAPPPFQPQPGFVGWIRSSLTDPVGWRACVYLLLKLPIALLGAIGIIYIVAWGVGYSTFPVWWELIHSLAAHGDAVQVPGWLAWWTPNPVLVAQSVPTLAVSFALVPAGLCALIFSPWIVSGSNDLDRRVDPAGQVAQFEDGLLGAAVGGVDQLERPLQVDLRRPAIRRRAVRRPADRAAELLSGEPELHRDRHHLRLRPVVEVPLDPAQPHRRVVDRARPGHLQVAHPLR
jgi:hypothetical protein